VITTSGYNAADNRTTLSAIINAAADFTRTYTYDAINRMTQAEQSGVVGNPKVTFGYNDLGQIIDIDRYTNAAWLMDEVLQYDAANRLNHIQHNLGSDTIADYGWAMDSSDRILYYGISSFAYGSEPAWLDNHDYFYDAQNQITTVATFFGQDESYTYDANGNRTGGYTTTADNQLTNDGTYTYTYFNEGTRKRRTKISDGSYDDYVWDFRGRLAQVLSYGPTFGHPLLKTTTYTYDASDRRIKKQIAGSQTLTERYSYDGSDLTLVFEGASPTLKQRYLYGAQDGQVLTEQSAGTGVVTWLLPDQQGTIHTVTDGSVRGRRRPHQRRQPAGIQRILCHSDGFDSDHIHVFGQRHTGHAGHGGSWADAPVP